MTVTASVMRSVALHQPGLAVAAVGSCHHLATSRRDRPQSFIRRFMQQGMLERIWRESLKNYAVGLLVNLAAILAITYILSDDTSRFVLQWSGAALLLTALRFAQFLHAASRYRKTQTFLLADSFYLSLGLVTAGGLWAVLGWWGIHHYQGAQQFAIIVILASLAGGPPVRCLPSRWPARPISCCC
jgi:hypothetical protein